MLDPRQQTRVLSALVLLIFALIFVAVRTAEYPQSPSYNQHEDKDAKGRQESESGETTLKWLTKDAASFFTFVLALLTAVLAGVSIVQIVYLQRADQTAGIVAKAILKTAEASLTQARVAEQTFIGLERPLILPSDIQVTVKNSTAPSLDGHGFRGVVTAGAVFQNYGRTPGIISEIRMSVQSNDWPHRCQPSSDNLIDVEIIVPPISIWPQKFVASQGAVFDRDGNFLVGRLKLFLEIRVIYFDAFDTKFVRLFTAQIMNQGKLEVIKGAGYSGEKRQEAKYSTDSDQKPT